MYPHLKHPRYQRRILNGSTPYRGPLPEIPVPHLRTKEDWLLLACIKLNRWQQDGRSAGEIRRRWEEWEKPGFLEEWVGGCGVDTQ